jgi:hypothetical protein
MCFPVLLMNWPEMIKPAGVSLPVMDIFIHNMILIHTAAPG